MIPLFRTLDKLSAQFPRISPCPHSKVTKDDIAGELVGLGVPRGGLLFVHSSLSAIGEVEGGADAVVDALLEALGPEGTLVVPTFTYADPHDYPDSIDPKWIFDPATTHSGMGADHERRSNA